MDSKSIYKSYYNKLSQLNLSNLRKLTLEVDKQVITQAKKTKDRAWLSEVSNIVLQQSFRDLQTAWNNYFSSLKEKRKAVRGEGALNNLIVETQYLTVW